MKVAIPSHNRSNTIGKQALKFVLQDLEIPAENVYVFVSNQAMLEDYKKKIKEPVNFVCTDTDNVRDKFNYIHTYWTDGENVLLVEDDMKGLATITDRHPKKIIQQGFQIMEQKNKFIWGIYPSSNKLFMQQTISEGFAFIVANMYGFKADGDRRILGTEHFKHDYERSILYTIHKGGVIRINYVCPVTNNYTNKGGMQDLDDRAAGEHQACLNLMAKYPDYVDIKRGTKSRFTEIKFIRKIVND